MHRSRRTPSQNIYSSLPHSPLAKPPSTPDVHRHPNLLFRPVTVGAAYPPSLRPSAGYRTSGADFQCPSRLYHCKLVTIFRSYFYLVVVITHHSLFFSLSTLFPHLSRKCVGRLWDSHGLALGSGHPERKPPPTHIPTLSLSPITAWGTGWYRTSTPTLPVRGATVIHISHHRIIDFSPPTFAQTDA